MSDFLSKHPVKIAIGTLVIAIASIVSFGVFIGQAKSQIDKIPAIELKADKVPVLENDIVTIKDDVKEIKGDIKTLLNRK